MLLWRSYNPAAAGTAPVWALPRSLATTGGITFCFLFLRVLRCFSSPRLPPQSMRMAGLRPAGLPHSGTRGSRAACASPRLFAACRAFHRLPEPQASAVRPFLLSPAWTTFTPSRRIPWLILSFSVESRFLLSSLLFQHVNDPFCHLCGNGWRITDSNR